MIDTIKQCDQYVDTVCVNGLCTSGARELGRIKCLDQRPRDVCSKVDKPADSAFLDKLVTSLEYFEDKTQRSIEYRRSCSRTPICMQGNIEFGETSAREHVKFVTIVYLEEPGVGAPAPPSYTYDVFLEAGRKDYVVRKSISQEIKPGDVDHFLVRVATDRSAQFKLSMEILDAGEGSHGKASSIWRFWYLSLRQNWP